MHTATAKNKKFSFVDDPEITCAWLWISFAVPSFVISIDLFRYQNIVNFFPLSCIEQWEGDNSAVDPELKFQAPAPGI